LTTHSQGNPDPTQRTDAPVFPGRSVPDDPNTARLLGLYPQRQEGLWMQRLKLLGGNLSSAQWRALADIARRFTPGTPLHLTTRQDIELHDLTPDRVGEVQQALAEAEITTVGACGDTLRNITVCPCSGTVSGLVDLAPLAQEIRRVLEAEEGVFALPRKFKISLSACHAACGQPWINDLGLQAVRRGGRWGFRVMIAGSLGARPATGIGLFDRIEPGDVPPLALAALRVHAAYSDREHRGRARLRHVRERLGDGPFRELVIRTFKSVRESHDRPAVELPENPSGFDASIALPFPNGDVWPDQAEGLAKLTARDDVRLRIGNHHRVMVFGREEASLRETVGSLVPVRGEARPGATFVACPGSRWCGRALTDTNDLADLLRDDLAGQLPPETTICISGCPNGCAHSAVADVGLTGALAKDDGRTHEVWNLFFGGGGGRSPGLARQAGRRLSPEQVVRETRRRLSP